MYIQKSITADDSMKVENRSISQQQFYHGMKWQCDVLTQFHPCVSVGSTLLVNDEVLALRTFHLHCCHQLQEEMVMGTILYWDLTLLHLFVGIHSLIHQGWYLVQCKRWTAHALSRKHYPICHLMRVTYSKGLPHKKRPWTRQDVVCEWSNIYAAQCLFWHNQFLDPTMFGPKKIHELPRTQHTELPDPSVFHRNTVGNTQSMRMTHHLTHVHESNSILLFHMWYQ